MEDFPCAGSRHRSRARAHASTLTEQPANGHIRRSTHTRTPPAKAHDGEKLCCPLLRPHHRTIPDTGPTRHIDEERVWICRRCAAQPPPNQRRFCSPLRYEHWRRRAWLPACRLANAEGLTFHDLRRANATGLIAEGVDIRTAQTRLAPQPAADDRHLRAVHEHRRRCCGSCARLAFSRARFRRCAPQTRHNRVPASRF